MSNIGKSIYLGSMGFLFIGLFRNRINISNIPFYVIMCVVFMAVTLGTYMVLDRKEGNNNKTEKIWSVLPVISLVVWMILFYINETKTEFGLKKEEVIRHYFPLGIWMVITVVSVIICIIILNKSDKIKSWKYKGFLRLVISVLFSFATAIQFYAPNIFQDIQGGTYHSHAYTNSILNVCWLVPYSDNMESLYGHYAIFFMPILKILHSVLGVDYLTGIFVVCAVVAGISILLFAWILNCLTQNDLIFYLAMFAIGEKYFMLMQGGVGLQLHPHRIIFPILLTAFVLMEERKKKQYNIFAVVILIFAVIWSTEVGLVMMAAFALYRWVYKSMDGKGISVKKCLSLFPHMLFFVAIPFLLAYGIVNLYNIIAGGNVLDLEAFLFPLISERGYIENIQLALPNVTHAWIGTSLLFLSMVSFIIPGLFAEKKEKEKRVSFCFFIGIMSLGLLLYYVNRPVEGSLFIILMLMLVLQVIILEKAQDKYKVWKETKSSVWDEPDRVWFLSIRVITILILCVMTFDCLYSMPKAWKASKETIWKREELQEFADYIYEQVPPEAVAFGEGVPELLSMIDRDTHLHTTEWSIKNMPLDTMKEIRYELEGKPWIFCSMYSLWIMQEEYPGLTDGYELHELFEYNGVEFGLWKKRNSIF